MGLISKSAMVKWNGANKKHYESLGYVFTKIGDEFEVRVEDLTKGSITKVKCKCDGCGKNLYWAYNDYNHIVKRNGNTYCQTCGNNIYHRGTHFSKSFYQWCVENDRFDAIERWDYELNNCSPKDITYQTNKKYCFKCDVHPEHHSELKNIFSLTGGRDGSIKCNQCNSIAQYILDNFKDKDLYDIWDKDKNVDLNPWEVRRGSNKKIWVKCQENDYHGSYETTCFSFTEGKRCPYCNNKKIHPKDSLGQYIIDNYGECFLHNIWSDKNNISPFTVSPHSNKKVWWKCQEGEHKDYLRTCNDSFRFEFRCPKCVGVRKGSIIEKKAKKHLEKIGYKVLTEHDCTVRPINPKTKMPMPYDNEIILSNKKHLIIEVHGEQHYDARFYRTMLCITSEEAEEKLKQRKLYDRYKKAYAEHFNYEYLELPYWSFEGKNKDLYKQMIDNKIKEILEKEEDIA